MEKNVKSFYRLMSAGARLYVNGEDCRAWLRGQAYEILYEEFREAMNGQELRLVYTDPVNGEAIYMAGAGMAA